MSNLPFITSPLGPLDGVTLYERLTEEESQPWELLEQIREARGRAGRSPKCPSWGTEPALGEPGFAVVWLGPVQKLRGGGKYSLSWEQGAAILSCDRECRLEVPGSSTWLWYPCTDPP